MKIKIDVGMFYMCILNVKEITIFVVNFQIFNIVVHETKTTTNILSYILKK